MRKDWRTAWYERHPEGLVGRLRGLLRSNPEAARAMAERLEREGWGPWWVLLEDLQAPRALCKMCEGHGVVWSHPLAKVWQVPHELRDEWWADCPTCGGRGLMPYPLTEWEEVCRECWGEGGWWAYHPHQPDDDIWVECPECGGLGAFTRLSPAAYAERVEGRIAEDFPPDEPLPF